MSTLFDRLETLGATRLSEDTLNTFLAAAPQALILVTGDLRRYREASDSVVIFPDLVKAVEQTVGGVVAAGFVTSEAESDALRAELGVLAYPCVVAFRNGRFAGAVSKLRAWTEYVADTAALFQTPLPAVTNA